MATDKRDECGCHGECASQHLTRVRGRVAGRAACRKRNMPNC